MKTSLYLVLCYFQLWSFTSFYKILKFGIFFSFGAYAQANELKAGINASDIIFIILDQKEESHIQKGLNLKNIILKTSRISHLDVKIEVASEYGDIDLWVYFPWPPKLLTERTEGKFYIFLEEDCEVDLDALHVFLQKFDFRKDLFIGKALHDKSSTIIHHFDHVDINKPFFYPDPRTGIIISQGLFKRIALNWNPMLSKIDFSIDAPYELAKYISSLGVKLIPSSGICVTRKDGCFIWTKHFPKYITIGNSKQEGSITLEKIHFAIKTCQKLSNERLPIIKDTWLSEALNYGLYSDVEDSFFGTHSFGIPSTERGHCMKTLEIIRHAAKMENIEWLVIADDDTLLSPTRLSSLLERYDSSSLLALGERYGYMVSSGAGFNYLTGGAGIVLSKNTIALLAKEGKCECPMADTPDDMFLGSCLQRHQIQIIHSRRFHQARPDDYSLSLLSDSAPISFHKFWLIEPREIYRKWLKDSFPKSREVLMEEHTEL